MKCSVRTTLVNLSLWLALCPPAGADDRLSELIMHLAGTFDNERQIAELRRSAEGDQGLRQVALTLRPVQAAALGAHVVYAEYRDRGRDDRSFRRRLYTVEWDDTRGQAMLGLWIPKDDEALARRVAEASGELGVTAADFVVLPGCDIYLQPHRDAWVGSMDFGECTYEPVPGMQLPDDIERVISFSRVAVDAHGFAFADALYDHKSQQLVQRLGGGSLHELDRVRSKSL